MPLWFILLSWLAAAEVPAPPAIEPGAIVNAASRMPASLAGGAIARGARFIIPGVRLGPEQGVRGNEAEPAAVLAGVAVRVTQASAAVNAGILFASADRIEAWMPDSTPLGAVQLTVTYQGRVSEPYPLTIVESSFGFYPAEVSASPGETVRMRGTGLGAGKFAVLVGGKRVSGVGIPPPDACCKGVQTIEFQTPRDAPPGCAVPVQAVTADGRPSNVAGIAIHPPGKACSDYAGWFRESVEHARNAGFVALAHVSLEIGAAQYLFDYGIGSFGRQESGQRPFPPLPPARTCTLFTERTNLRQLYGQVRSPESWTSIPKPLEGNQRLDAGVQLLVSGPGATRALARGSRRSEYYGAVMGGLPPFTHSPALPAFLRPGVYRVSAAGGPDIGPFAVKVAVSSPIVWKNRARIAEVRRADGVTVEWRGARKGDAVLIAAGSADGLTGDSAVCLCVAAATDGRFTIPPVALANLPPSRAAADLDPGYLLVSAMPSQPPARIQASGLDEAFAAFVSASVRLVKYR